MFDSYILAGYEYNSIWSTRKANSRYDGPCMRVRRSSDNLEQDIYFSGVNLDTSSLLSFAGSNFGYVTVWYDQAYSLVTRNMMKFSSSGLNVGTFRYWNGGGNASATFNAVAAPDSSINAVRINYTSTSGLAIYHSSAFPVKKNTDYTFSVYAQSGTTSEFVLRFSNGSLSVILGEATFISTSGWARYSVTVNTGVYDYIVCSVRNGYSFSTGQVGNLFFWGSQLEEGNVMTDFEPTEFKALRGFDLTGAGSVLPMICSGGTVNTVNGKPALYYNGTSAYMQYFQYFGIFNRSDFYLKPIKLNTIQKGSWSTYIVTKPTRLNHAAIQCLYGSDFNQGGGVRIGTFSNIGANSTIPYSVAFANNGSFLGSYTAGTGFTGDNQISSSYKSNVSATQYLDGISGTPLTITASNDQTGYYGVGCRIRNAGPTEFYQGYIQEIQHNCDYIEATREDYELAAKNYYITLI